MTHADTQANVDPAELERFARLAARWWDKDGESRPLHDLNPVRLDFVAARVALAGARVLDVGCGGGILSESLARAGARVVAIDLAEALLEVARLHRVESGVEVDYRLVSSRALAQAEPASFDAVCCMELIEHVPDPAALVADLAALCKPGGQVFLSTLNRTPIAFGAAILGAEYVLGLLPRGTHRYASFIRPSELARMLRAVDLEPEEVRGIGYNPIGRRAWLSARTAVNYIMSARRR